MKKKQFEKYNPPLQLDPANDKKYYKFLDEAYNGTLSENQKIEVVNFLKMMAQISLEIDLTGEKNKADDKATD